MFTASNKSFGSSLSLSSSSFLVSSDDDDDDDDDTEEISIFSNDARGRVKKGVFGVVVVVVRAAVSRRRGCFDGIVAGVGADARTMAARISSSSSSSSIKVERRERQKAILG